ncbi:MAG TPA: TIGR03560 family F420-dependent LLM class oxidoreductase [Candidatus Limnocylindrales bacterium]|nr:TIGR03560 family F420-dependent LLM class oxidoreductase [Candidatus Limnocylindrales bacterium]
MNLGVIVSPAAGYSYDELVGLATESERAGIESFWVSDHFFGGEGFPDRDCLEAWTLLAALARDTKTIRLGCLVTAAQYRNPALLAKIVASVDQMSGGRVEFGIGAGWKDNEYKAYGYEFPDAGTRVTEMNETIQICKMLWTQDRSTFAGKRYRVEDAVCAPKPRQRPHPPIWVGGRGPRVMRSAARYADGFDISRRSTDAAPMDADAIRVVNAELDEACRGLKRDRRLMRSHWSSVSITDDASVKALRERIAGFAAAGLDRFILAFPRESATEMIRRVPV